MKQNHQCREDAAKSEKPHWQFNLRRISSSRAEILDLNKSANNPQKSKNNPYLKNLDEYIYNIKRDKYNLGAEQQSYAQKLAEINLVNKPLLELSCSDVDLVNNEVMKNCEQESNDNQLIVTGDMKFDVNHSLIDQIHSIRNKLAETKSLPNETTNGLMRSKIDVNVLKAISKTAKNNDSYKEEITSIKTIHPGIKPLPIERRQQTTFTECVLECLNNIGASSVPNENFQHVLSEIKISKCLSYLKCEFIYGDHFYWIVKIKRYYHNLFQIKFIKHVLPTLGTASTVSLSNLTVPIHVSTIPKRNSENFDTESLRQGISMNEPNSISPNSSMSSAQSEKIETKFIEKMKENVNDSFFFSINSKQPAFCQNLRPIGWSKANGYFIQKPDIDQLANYKNDHIHHDTSFDDSEIQDFFTECSNKNTSFRAGSLCELESENEPNSVEVVTVKSYKGGRLLVEFSDLNREWVFYSDTRLHPLGWAKKNNMKYLGNLRKDQHLEEEKFNSDTMQNENDFHQVANQIELRHERQQHFKLNHYVECLYMNKFYAARVCHVQPDLYFQIKLTTKHPQLHEKVLKFYLTSNVLSTLFPCKWCSKLNLVLEPPQDWEGPASAFDWDDYIDNLNSKEERSCFALTEDLSILNWQRSLSNLAEKFLVGSYIECVDMTKQSEVEQDIICLAQIKAKLAHLIFVKVVDDECTDQLHVFSVDSLKIFPVGWCEMNNYYESFEKYKRFYKFPRKELDERLSKRIVENLNRSSAQNVIYFSQFKEKESWCDKIYLHANCNTGPYFLKSKLNWLPKSFGPGPIILVLSKLIQMLINVSDKPPKLLKLLQASRRAATTQTNLTSNNIYHHGFTNFKHMERVRLKAKDKGKYIFKEVEVCTQINQLGEFLNGLCHKLKSCNQMLNFNTKLKNNEETGSRTNRRICVELKCCLLCTINYLSSPTAIIDQQQHSRSLTKLNTLTYQSKVPQSQPKRPHSNSLSSSNPRHQNHTSNIKSSSKLVTMQNTDQVVHSPIKTRLNVRQNLLQQEELDRLQHLKQKEKNPDIAIVDEVDTKHEKRIKLERNGQPPVKKTRKSKNSEIPVESSSVKPVDQNSSLQSMNTSNNSMENVLNTSTTTNLLTMNQNQTNSPNSSIVNSTFPGVTSQGTNHNRQKQAQSPTITSNPIYWQADEVSRYLIENRFEPHLIYLIKEHEIDGQSFLMLNLPTIQNHMKLKLGPAIKLAHLVEKLKQIYFNQFKVAS